MNLIEAQLAASAGLDRVQAGDDIVCRLSFVAAHDVTAPIAIKTFREMGASRVFDREKVALVVDHVYPAATEKARANAIAMADFAREQGITIHQRGEGVIHQLMYERHRQTPGSVIAIADSHTGTAGGYGVIGIGVGSTEIAAAMVTGTLDLEVPEVVQVYLEGECASNVSGKDIILHLAGIFGADRLTDRALLITGPGLAGLANSDRMTICNMGIELGAMITLCGTEKEEESCAETHVVDLTALVPLLARPFSPVNVVPVSAEAGVRISQVVVGSCTGGRLEDMAELATAWAGKKIHPRVNALVVPASAQILGEMEELGYCRVIREAGATLLNPGCGSCFGAHEGLAADRDVVVSTTNRNFPGRMGSKKARIYLASAATAAASALNGEITRPEVTGHE